MKKIMWILEKRCIELCLSMLLVAQGAYSSNYPSLSSDQNMMGGDPSSFVPGAQLSAFPQGGVNPVPLMQESSVQQHWQKNAEPNYDTYRQFNWQQRKLLKQKTYKIYMNVLSIISDIEKVIAKYKEKERDIIILVQKLDSDLVPFCQVVDSRFQSISDLYRYAEAMQKEIQEFQKKEYFSMNKNFRDLVETIGIEITNIQKMIDNVIQNKNDLESLKDTVCGSFQILDQVYGQSKNYENQLWTTYQYLDELISDVKANEYYSMIINFSDNIIQINNFLRSDFLSFFNQSLSSLNYSSSAIKNAMQDLNNYIKNVSEKRDQASRELVLYEEEKKQQEIAKKKQEEEEARLAEEKKQKEIAYKKKLEQAKPWYLKLIFDFSALASKSLEGALIEGKKIVFFLFTYFKNLIGGKIVRKKPEVIKKPFSENVNQSDVSAVVDPSLAELPAQENILPQEFTFGQSTSPSSSISPINDEAVVGQENPTEPMINPGETILSDVFSQQQPVQSFSEKIISGASSYPTNTTTPAIPAPQAIPMPENPAINDLSITEDIPVVMEQADDVSSNESENTHSEFYYAPLEQGESSSSQAPDSLIPSLDDVSQPMLRDAKTSFETKNHAGFHAQNEGKKVKSSSRVKKKKKNNN
jgi:hypothetical protein